MKHTKGWIKWYIHPFTYVYGIFSIGFGIWDIYLMTLAIVCFHEYCHYLMARYYHFEIGKIKILPFGAFLHLEDYGLRKVEQEAFVILAGLCSHACMYIFFKLFGFSEIWFSINQMVLFFNILPIYPLDGSKLLLLVLCLFLDYKQAIQLQIQISILVLSMMIVLFFDYRFVVIFGYLFYCIYQYIKEYRYMLIRLYLQRSLDIVFLKKKLHEDLSFYRTYHNYYFTSDGFIDEILMKDHLIKDINK